VRLGVSGIVPQSVPRQHCSGDGRALLPSLVSQNGRDAEFDRVTKTYLSRGKRLKQNQ
jgi:hypothetical protein